MENLNYHINIMFEYLLNAYDTHDLFVNLHNNLKDHREFCELILKYNEFEIEDEENDEENDIESDDEE